MADLLPSQLNIDALNTTMPNMADLADIAQCPYMHGRSTPQSIEHRCLEYHYTKLGRSSRYSTLHIIAWQIYPLSQLNIDALNTTMPNWADLADISQCTYMHGRLTPPPSQLSIDALHTTTPNWTDLTGITQCT